MKSNHVSTKLRCRFPLALAAVFTFLIALPGAARADELRPVDGNLWKTLPKIAKQAYLVGVNNLIDVEYAYQMKYAKPRPTNQQTLIQRMYKSGGGQTIDNIILAADAWYKKHPDKLNKAVLDVLWLIYVEHKG